MFLQKPLAVARFKSLIEKLGVYNCYRLSACGGVWKKSNGVRKVEQRKSQEEEEVIESLVEQKIENKIK